MYVADSRSSKAPVAPAAGQVRRGAALRAVPGAVLVLGTVSMVTDVSSEMVNAVLPLYLLTGLGLSPLGFGLLDGIQNGFSALVRLVGG
ncbi:MAG TPA: MFS transporter, partial [Kitasatospora aureofaciens]|nr:MFS transporter [Kitasatospora aureofaciens]